MGILLPAIPRANLLAIFVIIAFCGISLAQNCPDVSSENPTGASAVPGHLHRMGKEVTEPRITHQTDPVYSEKARQAKIQGTVLLSLIVDPSGTPTMIKVCQGLGSGLDEKAIESVRQWKFEPGTFHGRPAAVAVNVEVDFHLRK
jgi:periplasmic protein TonB